MHSRDFAALLARFTVTLTVTATMAACGGTVASTGTPPDLSAKDGGANNPDTSAPPSSNPIPPPQNHRPTAEACTAPRPPGISAADAAHFEGACHTDAECTDGKNGRCILADLEKLFCSYDQCAQDSECGAGVCNCRNGSAQGANTCFNGNCTTDANCPGSYCSPSGTDIASNCFHTRDGDVPASSLGYFCHTHADECIDDKDCKGDEPKCVFKTDTQKWGCLSLLCTGGA